MIIGRKHGTVAVCVGIVTSLLCFAVTAKSTNVFVTEDKAFNAFTQIKKNTAAALESTSGSVSKDDSGWTLFTPAADARIIYVSSSEGNDDSAEYYLPSQLDDLFLPGEQIKPFKSIAAAYEQIRDGQPDWILLKRGDTWIDESMGGLINGQYYEWRKSGRSKSEPVLISSYGDAKQRPALLTGKESGFSANYVHRQKNFIALIGIAFRPHTYTGAENPSGLTWLGSGGSLLVEDCVFEGYSSNVVIQQRDLALDKADGFTIRRSIIKDCFSTASHSEGIFMYNVQNVLIEENLIDHNGWKQEYGGREAAGQTVFNHNLYIKENVDSFVFRRNISARASATGLQARGGGLIENNLFLNNPTSVNQGWVNGSPFRDGGITGTIKDNVILGSAQLAGDDRGIGINIGNVSSKGVVVSGNIVAHDLSGKYNSAGIHLRARQSDGTMSPEGLNNITITGNKVFDWRNNLVFSDLALTEVSNVEVRANEFQEAFGYEGSSPGLLIRQSDSNEEISYSDNSYSMQSGYSPSMGYRVGTDKYDFDDWKRDKEPSALDVRVNYQDPNRTMASYQGTLGKEETLESFLREAANQSRLNWRPEYTADSACAYIRAGFELLDSKPIAVQPDTPPADQNSPDLSPPDMFLLRNPSHDSTVSQASVIFRWDGAADSSPPVSYQLRVARAGETVVIDTTVFQTFAAGTLPKVDSYSWQVIARDTFGNARASSAFTFIYIDSSASSGRTPTDPKDSKPVVIPDTHLPAPPDSKPIAPPDTGELAPPDTKEVEPPDTKPVVFPDTKLIEKPDTGLPAPPDSKPIALPDTGDLAPPDTKELEPPDTPPADQNSPDLSPPDMFLLRNPSHDSTVSQASVIFRWDGASDSSPPVSYQLRVARAGETVVIDTTVFQTFAAGTLPKVDSYSWHVIARDTFGNARASSAFTFIYIDSSASSGTTPTDPKDSKPVVIPDTHLPTPPDTKEVAPPDTKPSVFPDTKLIEKPDTGLPAPPFLRFVNPIRDDHKIRGRAFVIANVRDRALTESVKAVAFQYRLDSDIEGIWRMMSVRNTQFTNPAVITKRQRFRIHWELDGKSDDALQVPAGCYQIRAVAIFNDNSYEQNPDTKIVNIVADRPDRSEIGQPDGSAKLEEEIFRDRDNLIFVANEEVSAEFSIPARALSSETSHVIVSIDPHRLSVPLGRKPIGSAVKASISSGQSFFEGDKTVAVTLSYMDEDQNGQVDNSGIMETDLELWVYSNGRWEPLDNQFIDTAHNTVSGQVRHFSTFQLVGPGGSADLSAFSVYPNPFMPNDGDANTGREFDGTNHSGINFYNLPTQTRIRVYSLLGEEVIDMRTDNSTGRVQWNARNDAGHPVASGYYLYIIENVSTGQKITGKLAVIR